MRDTKLAGDLASAVLLDLREFQHCAMTLVEPGENRPCLLRRLTPRVLLHVRADVRRWFRKRLSLQASYESLVSDGAAPVIPSHQVTCSKQPGPDLRLRERAERVEAFVGEGEHTRADVVGLSLAVSQLAYPVANGLEMSAEERRELDLALMFALAPSVFIHHRISFAHRHEAPPCSTHSPLRSIRTSWRRRAGCDRDSIDTLVGATLLTKRSAPMSNRLLHTSICPHAD